MILFQKVRNTKLFPWRPISLGTGLGTPHGNGAAPLSCKASNFACSYVPNLSFMEKEIAIKTDKHAKRPYMRVKGFLGSGNIGGSYA